MINILPLAQKVLVRRMRILRLVSTYLASVIALMAVAVVLLLPTFETIKARSRALGSYSRELQASGSMVSPAQVTELQARTKVVRERLTAKLPPSPLVFVAIAESHAVSGVKLVGFEVQNPEKHTMQVRGTATTRQALQQFITLLQVDARIAIVDSPITNFVKSAESEFTLTLTFTQS